MTCSQYNIVLEPDTGLWIETKKYYYDYGNTKTIMSLEREIFVPCSELALLKR